MSSRSSPTKSVPPAWTPVPVLYDFGRPLPYRYLLYALRSMERVRRLLSPGGRLIYEPGAGTGRVILPIASEFHGNRYIASDTSPNMLEVLRLRAFCQALSNISVIEADLMDTSYLLEPVDCIILSSVLHSVPEWRRALCRLVTALSPEGVMLLIGEEADLYNLALGRTGSTESKWPIADGLKQFWADYSAQRLAVGLEHAEASQVGCAWNVTNSNIVSELSALHFTQADEARLTWEQPLLYGDLMSIVRGRCYSSMFQSDPTAYSALVAHLEGRYEHLVHESAGSSTFHLQVRLLTRSD